MIHVIGAGGVGSYLLPCLVKYFDDITVWDGDVFEEKNLERQNFDFNYVGKNKAEYFASIYPTIKARSDYFNFGDVTKKGSVFLCCVDNGASVLDCLNSADICKGIAIRGGNETYSAEAFIYDHSWKETAVDIRNIYPEILEGGGRDPRNPSCTQEAEENPQVAGANFMAAAMMLRLIDYYSEDTKFPREIPIGRYNPIIFKASLESAEVLLTKDFSDEY